MCVCVCEAINQLAKLIMLLFLPEEKTETERKNGRTLLLLKMNHIWITVYALKCTLSSMKTYTNIDRQLITVPVEGGLV